MKQKQLLRIISPLFYSYENPPVHNNRDNITHPAELNFEESATRAGSHTQRITSFSYVTVLKVDEILINLKFQFLEDYITNN